jgi:hypothetical protein
LLAALLVASGCSAPLAPGYTVASETRNIRFVPGSPSRLEIHCHYVLQNSGTTELPFIDIKFPDANAFGRKEVKTNLDGRPVILGELPEEYRPDNPDTLRLAFESPWKRRQRHSLDLEYELSSPGDSGSRISIGEDSFHLGSTGWSTEPLPPRHLLSPYPKRPLKMTYSVRVPSDFLVLARGNLASRKQAEGSQIDYIFRLAADDLSPFVVAGHYTETPLGARSGGVVFWTFKALAQNPGSAPERIAQAWTVLENDFGPIGSSVQSPHIVEAPNLRSRIEGESAPAAASFPGGALINQQTLALGISSDEFIQRVSHALAHNWFGGEMYPTGAAELAMGQGLPEYATIVIDEARNGPSARQHRIQLYLTRYDEARKNAQEKPLGVTLLTDPPGPRAIALAKAPLMYVALEDACGEHQTREGLKHLVTTLRGEETGFDDLRAALEETCGRDLGEFFRTWLYGTGLPPDFRGRYASDQNGGN